MHISRRGAFAIMAASPLAACAQAPTTPADMVNAATFAAWLDRYKQAWEERDAARAGALFTPEASYHEMPFDPPKQGRAAIETYWSEVTANQSNIVFSYEVIICAGDQGVAHWHAAFDAGGQGIELDGVFVCKFSDAETVSALREWWHVRADAPAAPD